MMTTIGRIGHVAAISYICLALLIGVIATVMGPAWLAQIIFAAPQ